MVASIAFSPIPQVSFFASRISSSFSNLFVFIPYIANKHVKHLRFSGFTCTGYCLNNSYIYSKRYYCNVKHPYYIDFGQAISHEEKVAVSKNMIVIESFLSEDDEKSLLTEIEPYMKRLRYEFDHWDNAIHGFRETERLKWNDENTKIINRVRECAFLPGSPQLKHVHILDLAEEGYIKPHIDSVRFCGNTIAGMSLLSDAVMRLVHDKEKPKTLDILLKRRSLYIMRDSVRYDYTHEVLSNKESKFQEVPVVKKRRISIICRNEPVSSSQ